MRDMGGNLQAYGTDDEVALPMSGWSTPADRV